MNTRKIAFIIISGVVVIGVLILFFVFSLGKSSAPQNSGSASPTSAVLLEGSQSLKLVSSSPSTNTVNVPLTATITLTFNRTIENLTPSISFTPPAPFTFSSSQNILTITPSTPFSPSTNYTAAVTVGGQTFITSFTSFGPTPTPGPSTRDKSQIDQENLILKEQYPDTYLSNKTPYSNADFSVISELNQTTGVFVFTVTSKTSIAAAQSSFKQWAKEQGLTDTQISSLQVAYK